MKMILTTYENQKIAKKIVYFLSVFYRNNDGAIALVVTEDNNVIEVNPYDLSMPTAEYNKIFAE